MTFFSSIPSSNVCTSSLFAGGTLRTCCRIGAEVQVFISCLIFPVRPKSSDPSANKSSCSSNNAYNCVFSCGSRSLTFSTRLCRVCCFVLDNTLAPSCTLDTGVAVGCWDNNSTLLFSFLWERSLPHPLG